MLQDKSESDILDIAVVGGGAAGCMAAIRSGELKRKVVLIERNDSIGRKILITGKGRCNITNIAPIETFIDKFGTSGKFLRTALFKFFNSDLIEFFRSHGLQMKIERQGRVFPEDDKARSVVDLLARCLGEKAVVLMHNSRLKAINIGDGLFRLRLENGETVCARRVIMAAGGASYKATGSMGDGYKIASAMGHAIVPLRPALVPLTAGQAWIKDLQGLALENVRITFKCGGKSIVSGIGELMFTHFGISGPLVLDLSGDIVALLGTHKHIDAFIDLKPGLTVEQLDKRLLKDFSSSARALARNTMRGYLPQRLIEVFIGLAFTGVDRAVSQITQKERRSIVRLFKALPLTITGSLPIEEAMVTAGGVSIKEINPRTMESKIIPGLYFAGEIIEGCASSGGYNLQQAFSTGYLAGESAAMAV